MLKELAEHFVLFKVDGHGEVAPKRGGGCLRTRGGDLEKADDSYDELADALRRVRD
jgi:hypothetical protein